MSDMPPVLVTVSGLDGSGKSTVVRTVARLLEEQGLIVRCVEALRCNRDLLRSVRHHRDRVGRRAEEFLADYVAWSAVHNVSTAVASGADVVLSDRYVLDHLANQAAFGVGFDRTGWVDDLLPTPDLAVQLEVSAPVACHRIRSRDGDLGWQDEAFLATVAGWFTAAQAWWSTPVTLLSSDVDPAALAAQVLELIPVRRAVS